MSPYKSRFLVLATEINKYFGREQSYINQYSLASAVSKSAGSRPAERAIAFCNRRGTAEQYIEEGYTKRR